MDDKTKSQAERLKRYAKLIESQTGKAVRPLLPKPAFRGDGYVNLVNKYGTSQDTNENYFFEREADVPDEELIEFYEGNGLFAKIIDAPAEEAVKHGFVLDDIKDQKVTDFCEEALDELDWEETVMTALKWSRLFGGAIIVMLINDGRGIEEPLDWSNIQSIDDLRVYDRSLIYPDTSNMFSYEREDPFRTRASRLGAPERYQVYSKYGNFTVHESRCLVFTNGILPENTTHSEYEFWGMPEYVKIRRAIRDTELAHSIAPKMLDKSVQAIYKMKDLAQLLSTEDGEDIAVRRLQAIDLARGLLSSILLDADGEDYDFKQFQFNGVSEVIDTTCNFLSALTSIPQTILFGRSPAGMNSTGESDLENWYSFVGRIQKRNVKNNLRYLLSIIFQAGVYTGEVDEVPSLKVEFNPLWTLSDAEQADLELKRAQIQQTKAATAQAYIDMQAIDSSEVRRKLADSDEFDVENMLDEYDPDDEDLFPEMEEDDPEEGNSSEAAPAATKLPQDMTGEDLAQMTAKGENNEDTDEDTSNTNEGVKPLSVGVIVIKDGKVLCGTRQNDTGRGLICGPGGKIENGETPEQAAFRETEEEFGISPKELIPLGYGPKEVTSGFIPSLFLCTDYIGTPYSASDEIKDPEFISLEDLELLSPSLFQPFKDGVKAFLLALDNETIYDGGPGSGNFGHSGVPGSIGGSAPSGAASCSHTAQKIGDLKSSLKNCPPDLRAKFVIRAGMVPVGEADQLLQGAKQGDESAISRISEIEDEYIDRAEYGYQPRELTGVEYETREELQSMSRWEQLDWVDKAIENTDVPEGLNDSSRAQQVALALGLYETPQVVSREDFEAYVKDNETPVIFRGVKGREDMSGTEMIQQMATDTQNPYFGFGVHGDGLYFSTAESTGRAYAGDNTQNVAKCTIRPDAKVWDRPAGNDYDSYRDEDGNPWDASVYAMVNGYDAMRINNGGGEYYYVILNRAALIMEDPVSSIQDKMIKKGSK